VTKSEAKRRRLEQEIQKASSLATAVEPAASEDEAVAAPVVRYMCMEPPDSFFCPITHELMRNPLMLIATGRTYEGDTITEWMVNHDTDPLTNETITDKTLVPNLTLKQTIAEWSERSNQ
jgi:hypothetical protein